MRARHESGVAEQRDAINGERGRHEVEDRLQERQRGLLDDLGELRRQQVARGLPHGGDVAPRHLLRRDAFGVVLAVGVGHQCGQLSACRGRPVPDEVPAPVAHVGAVVSAGHGVADHLFPAGQAETEVAEQGLARVARQGRFVAHAAPGHIAGVLRLHRGQKLAAHAGAQAVAADEQVSLQSLARGQSGLHTLVTRLHRHHRSTQSLAGRRHRCAQQRVQPAPRCQHLRVLPSALRRAARVEHHPRLNGNAQRVVHRHARSLQRHAQAVVRDDAGTAPLQAARRALQQLNLMPRAVQHASGHQATERATDDEDVCHRISSRVRRPGS